jgi:hypothetical protein
MGKTVYIDAGADDGDFSRHDPLPFKERLLILREHNHIIGKAVTEVISGHHIRADKRFTIHPGNDGSDVISPVEYGMNNVNITFFYKPSQEKNVPQAVHAASIIRDSQGTHRVGNKTRHFYAGDHDIVAELLEDETWSRKIRWAP